MLESVRCSWNASRQRQQAELTRQPTEEDHRALQVFISNHLVLECEQRRAVIESGSADTGKWGEIDWLRTELAECLREILGIAKPHEIDLSIEMAGFVI